MMDLVKINQNSPQAHDHLTTPYAKEKILGKSEVDGEEENLVSTPLS